MSCSIWLALVVFLALGGPPANAQSGMPRVIDGDTIDVAGSRIRLWGIDAPESKQQCERGGSLYSCGLDAATHLRAIIGSAWLSCEPRTLDKYGRTVALCRAGDVDIGAAMVRDGWAMAFVRYSRDYVVEEKEARDARRGLWIGTFSPPWEWRTAQRSN